MWGSEAYPVLAAEKGTLDQVIGLFARRPQLAQRRPAVAAAAVASGKAESRTPTHTETKHGVI